MDGIPAKARYYELDFETASTCPCFIGVHWCPLVVLFGCGLAALGVPLSVVVCSRLLFVPVCCVSPSVSPSGWAMKTVGALPGKIAEANLK